MATEQWKRLKKADKLKEIVDSFHRNEAAIYNDRPGNYEESKRLLIESRAVIDKLLEKM